MAQQIRISHQKAFALTRNQFPLLKRGFKVPVMVWGNKCQRSEWYNVSHDGLGYIMEPTSQLW